MEIVPFRSNRSKGVPNALNTCWSAFTTHLLALSRASVIMLVGNEVLDCFTSHIDPAAKGILANRGIYRQRIGVRDRLVVKVDFAQEAMRLFETFFTSADITTLQKAVADALKNH